MGKVAKEEQKALDKEVLEVSKKLLEANHDAYEILSKEYECDETKTRKLKEVEELVASGKIDEVAAKDHRLIILNSKYNDDGRVVISRKEALEEQEWDEVFQQLLNERKIDK